MRERGGGGGRGEEKVKGGGERSSTWWASDLIASRLQLPRLRVGFIRSAVLTH